MAENLRDEEEILPAFLLYISGTIFSTSSIDSATDPDANTIQQWYPVWRTLRQKSLTAMIGPVAVIRDWNSKLRIPFNPLIPFRLQDRSDSWCQEMLRFTKREIAEMSIILEIPDKFDNGNVAWYYSQHLQ